jgi:methionyl-tRNA synthetase
MPKRYYITTPIYYVNSVPHIGTTLTTFVSDVTARYHKMLGEEVTFLTGTDENGLKVKEAAIEQGRDPQAFVDEISARFVEIFKGMNIDYDVFIRTTEKRHARTVQEVFRILQEKGHIYKGTYEGWYDVSSETFYKEQDLVDGKSPDGNEVRWVQEENYFFRLSAFQKPLLDYIEEHPDFIAPENRRNEVISFIRQGLRDASISRENDGWGVPVPGDESRVVYVWFDALINYLSATGWPDEGWQDLWPADVQWMGKDILTRFHATLWPGILMGLELPLPKHLIAHGWILVGGTKMSKSRGAAVKPLSLSLELAEASKCSDALAVDAVRFYMAVTLPFENDSNFTYGDFYRRYNSDLANDLGNSLNRTLAMTQKFSSARVPQGSVEAAVMSAILDAKGSFQSAMARFRIDEAVESALDLVKFLNRYIDARAPWTLAKTKDPALNDVLLSMLMLLRAFEGLIRPIMPATADQICLQLNVAATVEWSFIGDAVSLLPGAELSLPIPLFPRISQIDLDLLPDELPDGVIATKHGISLSQIQERKIALGSRLSPATHENIELTTNMETENPKPETVAALAPAPKPEAPTEPISIEEFAKIQFRVGRVLEAEPVEGSDKLLKLQVVIGEDRRQIVAGIRANYSPIDLIGRQVIVVANLKPAKLRGVESQGMLLAAVDESGGAILLQPEKEAPEGAKVR